MALLDNKRKTLWKNKNNIKISFFGALLKINYMKLKIMKLIKILYNDPDNDTEILKIQVLSKK